jgi:hypothetical protein
MSSTMMPTMLYLVAIPTPFSDSFSPKSHQPRIPLLGSVFITTRTGRPGTARGLRAREKRRRTNPAGRHDQCGRGWGGFALGVPGPQRPSTLLLSRFQMIVMIPLR